jgi:sugar phosphate isomerase/epimerase
MPTPLSRRHFLKAATATGVALLGARHASAAFAAPAYKVGIQMYSLRGYPVDVALKHAHDLGFEVVEMYPGQFPIKSDDDQIAAMKKTFAELNLKCLGHGVNRFTADAEANRRIFEFAKKAGIRNLTADPDPAAFDNLDKLVEEFDIRIAIHNHGPSHRYNKVTDVLNAVRDHHTNIGACADLGHYIRSGEDPVEVIRSLKGRLYGVHLKDFAEQQEKTKGVILGKGHLDVPAVFRALRQVEFPADGSLSLEYEENKDNPLADIRECLAIANSAAQSA